jgi:molecular chaperone DnaJ
MKDYYKILGVNKNSTQDEIKKAYRKLSKQYHPDVNPDGDDKFKDVAEAYDTLGDENKRKQYDNPNPFGGGGSFDDLFSMFNESRFNGGRRQRNGVPDKIISLNITPQESLLGLEKTINFQRKENCSTCNGTGGERVTCGGCSGSGGVQQRFQIGGQIHVRQTTCPQCRGAGTVITNQCFTCHGTGGRNGFKTITVNIPKSVDNGDFLRVPGSGDYSLNGGFGDVVVKINMVKDGIFEKMGDNLFGTIKIAPEDIFKQTDIIVNHPEGDLKLKFPQSFDTSVPLRLRGKGYQNQMGYKGDCLIKFDVSGNLTKLTPEMSEKLKELLEQV